MIGLEMATVYQGLGSDVTIVELMEGIVSGADKVLVRPLFNEMKKKCTIYTSTKVVAVIPRAGGLAVGLEGKKAPEELVVDKILVSVGRVPNSENIGIDRLGVSLDARRFIQVNEQQRTSIPHIYAIGDVVPGPMLAHKASMEGRRAAETIAGIDCGAYPKCIPSVAYTSPEVALVGMNEAQAKEAGHDVGVGKFPFAASARAMTIGETAGFSKLIFDEKTHVVLGGEIVGPHAGELIAEVALGIESGLTVKDITATVHPHPSLSESVLMTAEVFEGTVTDLYFPKRR